MPAPKVEYTHFWATHWTDDETYWSALKMDNRLAPMGWGVKLWNDNLLDTFWKADLRSSAVRCYASADNSGERLALFLVNRLDSVQECCVELAGYGGAPEFRTSGIWAAHPGRPGFPDAEIRPGRCRRRSVLPDAATALRYRSPFRKIMNR